jgi:hypothetical protein
LQPGQQRLHAKVWLDAAAVAVELLELRQQQLQLLLGLCWEVCEGICCVGCCC